MVTLAAMAFSPGATGGAHLDHRAGLLGEQQRAPLGVLHGEAARPVFVRPRLRHGELQAADGVGAGLGHGIDHGAGLVQLADGDLHLIASLEGDRYGQLFVVAPVGIDRPHTDLLGGEVAVGDAEGPRPREQGPHHGARPALHPPCPRRRHWSPARRAAGRRRCR